MYMIRAFRTQCDEEEIRYIYGRADFGLSSYNFHLFTYIDRYMAASCFCSRSLAGTSAVTITAAGLSSQTVEVDGGDTTIHFWGPPRPIPNSKPKLVLIHGLGPRGIWQWRHQISFFAREFDVYVSDLLFFGHTFTKSLDRSEVFQATCVAKLLEKLGICR